MSWRAAAPVVTVATAHRHGGRAARGAVRVHQHKVPSPVAGTTSTVTARRRGALSARSAHAAATDAAACAGAAPHAGAAMYSSFGAATSPTQGPHGGELHGAPSFQCFL